jgi:hypothetical protein
MNEHPSQEAFCYVPSRLSEQPLLPGSVKHRLVFKEREFSSQYQPPGFCGLLQGAKQQQDRQ